MQGKNKHIALLFVSTFLGSLGQLFFKLAFKNSISFPIFLVAGLIAYVGSTIVYLFVLSRVNLSWAYGFGGLAYIFTVILAATVLAENVSVLRWFGVAIIAIGIVLIGLS